jgi:hypothetical protein
VVALALIGLGLLDGCFSGFRAAAGRDARTAKASYARAACLRGTAAGAVVVAAVASYCLVVIAADGDRYDEFVRAGRHLLVVLVPYGALVLAALLGYVAVPRTGVQTLMSTLVLGPFTLARPVVVAVATVIAVAAVDDAAVRAGVVLAALLVLAVEPALYRRPPPAVPPTPPPWAR